jgi:hypothetical protein
VKVWNLRKVIILFAVIMGSNPLGLQPGNKQSSQVDGNQTSKIT